MIVTVNTNGTLLNEDWATFFAKNPPRRVNVTLYGASGETYKSLCGDETGYGKSDARHSAFAGARRAGEGRCQRGQAKPA